MSTRKTTTTTRTGQTEVAELETYDLAKRKRYRSFVIYGRSGTGKTTLASTFPKPMLYMDVKDRGDDSITDVKGIKGYVVDEFADFEEAYWYLRSHKGEYKTVVVDTMSQLQQLVVQEQGAKKKGKKRAGDWGSLTKQDWGTIASHMKEWIIRYRDLPMNVVFIAQDRAFAGSDDDDESEGIIAPEIGPALSPAIAKALNAAVSMIGNTFIRTKKGAKIKDKPKKEKAEFCLRVGPNPYYTTKIRKPRGIAAPELIVDPSYEDILTIIEGE